MNNNKIVRTQGFFPSGNQDFWNNPYEWLGFNPNQTYTPYPFEVPSGMNFPNFNFPEVMGGQSGGTQQKTQTNQPPASLWEHVGGLDGIITHMGKVQKIMKMMQSMSPIMKMFTQSIEQPSMKITKKSNALMKQNKKTKKQKKRTTHI